MAWYKTGLRRCFHKLIPEEDAALPAPAVNTPSFFFTDSADRTGLKPERQDQPGQGDQASQQHQPGKGVAFDSQQRIIPRILKQNGILIDRQFFPGLQHIHPEDLPLVIDLIQISRIFHR